MTHPFSNDHLARIIREAWPEADEESVADIIVSAVSAARPLLGRAVSPGNEKTFPCRCVNPHHHLSNEDLLAAGYQPVESAIWGDPDPERAAANAVGIAEAAALRYAENMDAQLDGTADPFGIKRPIGWNARYDGDL
jgi:hypothetical protein